LVDALIGAIVYPLLLISLIITGHLSSLTLFVALDIGLASAPPIWKGYKLKSLRKVAKCLPSYFLVRFFNSYWFYYGFISVFVLKKGSKTFEKGHN